MYVTKTTLTLAILAVLGFAAARPAAAQVTVANPSFEADGTRFYYYGDITGWSGSNMGGVNGTDGGFGNDTANGPFANNGTIPDGTSVAFIQATTDPTTLSQDLTGFTLGDQYVVTFYDNARDYDGDALFAVTLDGVTIVPTTDVAPVGGTNPYNFVTAAPYTATGTTATLVFSSLVNTGDTTLLLDEVNIQDISPAAAPESSPWAIFAIGLLGLGVLTLKAKKSAAA